MQELDWSVGSVGPGVARKPQVGEVSEMAQRAIKERARFEDATASGFYRVLVFQSDAQAEAFARAAGWDVYEDEDDPCFVDGVAIAQGMGIALPECPPVRQVQINKRWGALVQENHNGKA